MKYWRGYLVAAIMTAISILLVQFALAHQPLIDMIYPYMTRMVVGSLAEWSASVPFCLWQVLLGALITGAVASIVLLILLRWNPIQWFGWILAVISCIQLFNTALFGLNEYTLPFAVDVRLEMTDYTISELSDATIYFRDRANDLAPKITRDEKGDPVYAEFEELAVQAADGFKVLTYEDTYAIFSGSTVPVKKLGMSSYFTEKGIAGMTVALTGEAAVNPEIPTISLPFVMCREMSRRMSIVDDEASKYAAYLACAANPSDEFRYSAYCIAYYHCYNALASIPTATAQASANRAAAGASRMLKEDMLDYESFFGAYSEAEGDTMTDMLASWYVQTYITPLLVEEEDPFDPTDTDWVDLTYKEPDPIPLEEWETLYEDEDDD